MTDILPILSGKKVDKILGKGSIALISDEVLIALTPTRVNGVEGCISIKIHDSQGCADVHQGIPEREKMTLVAELEDEHSAFTYLTMPMCHRPMRNAWDTAADILEALAKAARAQATKA